MPPKEAAPVEILLRAVGGEAANPASLAPKVGPLGLAPKKIGDDIAKATQDWKGLKITCKLTVVNRQATVEVVPTASGLIIKALGEPPRDRKKEKNIKHDGNITLDEIKRIAKIMRPKSLARTFAGTCKEILGTARAVGCTVDNEPPQNIIDKITSGEIKIPDEE